MACERMYPCKRGREGGRVWRGSVLARSAAGGQDWPGAAEGRSWEAGRCGVRREGGWEGGNCRSAMATGATEEERVQQSGVGMKSVMHVLRRDEGEARAWGGRGSHLCAAGRSSWQTMKTIMPPTIEKTMPKTRGVKKD